MQKDSHLKTGDFKFYIIQIKRYKNLTMTQFEDSNAAFSIIVVVQIIWPEYF